MVHLHFVCWKQLLVNVIKLDHIFKTIGKEKNTIMSDYLQSYRT